MKRSLGFGSLVLLAALAVIGCKSDSNNQTGKVGKTAVAVMRPSAAATTQPALNGVNGTVQFTQMGDGVRVTALIRGLKPNAKHGFHIHDKPDLSAPDLMSTGGHWDPDGAMHHGAPGIGGNHGGDLGNLESDSQGVATMSRTINGLSVGDGGKHDVVGHAVIIHAKEDDLSGQPAGNAGPRVAGGVIELKK